jgi:uncharacterized RDD family membrane protein YckC
MKMNTEPIDSFSFDETTDPQYAGFWIRFVAYLIDAIILGVISFAINLLIGFPSPFSGEVVSPWQNWLSTLMGFLYFALLESGNMQATVGKRALGLIVTNEKGRRISFLQATGRYFAKILSALILLIGFIMVGWDSKKQGLHDKLAGTLVVYNR